jgi:hypothetical protein
MHRVTVIVVRAKARLFNCAIFTHFSVPQFCARDELAKPRKTRSCRETREQYAEQENCVSRNAAERVKLNYLGQGS